MKSVAKLRCTVCRFVRYWRLAWLHIICYRHCVVLYHVFCYFVPFSACRLCRASEVTIIKPNRPKNPPRNIKNTIQNTKLCSIRKISYSMAIRVHITTSIFWIVQYYDSAAVAKAFLEIISCWNKTKTTAISLATRIDIAPHTIQRTTILMLCFVIDIPYNCQWNVPLRIDYWWLCMVNWRQVGKRFKGNYFVSTFFAHFKKRFFRDVKFLNTSKTKDLLLPVKDVLRSVDFLPTK
jgi:hypothetical protein